VGTSLKAKKNIYIFQTETRNIRSFEPTHWKLERCLRHVELLFNYHFKIRNKVSQIDHFESRGYIKLYELAVSGLYPTP